MMNNIGVSDRRALERRSPIALFCPYQLGIKNGRRSSVRRAGADAVYVDNYAWHIGFCCLAIVLLSATDAFLTLNILARGGVELNEFMAVLIEDNTHKFVMFKMALTSLAAIFLVIHHESRIMARLRCKYLLYAILTGYLCLVGYELALLNFIIPAY
ncbi:MAG TPA: DUF5658 family protein [Nitrosomonas mobilis]|nr:DUF5658 family protein [Nitrosomonas mobilis]